MPTMFKTALSTKIIVGTALVFIAAGPVAYGISLYLSGTTPPETTENDIKVAPVIPAASLVASLDDYICKDGSTPELKNKKGIDGNSTNKDGCNKILDKNCNGIYDKLGPDGQDCAQVEETGKDFSPSTCFYSMNIITPQPDEPVTPVPSSKNVNYQPMLKRCGTSGDNSGGENIPYTPISRGYYYYKFTVPAGTYNSVFIASVMGVSYQWHQVLVIKKDGDITMDEFNDVVREAQSNKQSNIMGEKNFWRGNIYDNVGINIGIMNSPDGAIKTVTLAQTANGAYPTKTTFNRDVTFTAIQKIDADGATNAIRFCYQ